MAIDTATGSMIAGWNWYGGGIGFNTVNAANTITMGAIK
jgi:hypothetical protein